MEVKQLQSRSRQKQFTVGDVWPENKRSMLTRRMSYSESVKQPKRQGNNERSSPKTVQNNTGQREHVKLNAFENFRKEKLRLKKSLEVMDEDYKKLKENFDRMVSYKKRVIKEKNFLINQCFFKDNTIRCNCKKVLHEDKSCFENVSNNILDRIFALNGSMSIVKRKYEIMRKKNDTLKELLELEFGKASLKVGIEDDSRKTKKTLQECNENLKEDLVAAKNKLEEAVKLEFGHTKQEDFMKNRVKMLTDQVESRLDDMTKIDEEIAKADKSYKEKYVVMDSLQEQLKDVKKELSEAILNRRQFNLCLKENFSYDQQLRQVLEERERVQYDYGAVMEEMTVLQNQFDVEEKNKEKWCMSIVAKLNEGQQNRMEYETINARINQLHSEIFVRHGFMHAKEIQINELTEKCKELEDKILVCNSTELSLKTECEEVQCKLRETLFDICFAMSWHFVGEENASDAELKSKVLSQKLNSKDEFKEPCEYIDLDQIEQETSNN